MIILRTHTKHIGANHEVILQKGYTGTIAVVDKWGQPATKNTAGNYSKAAY